MSTSPYLPVIVGTITATALIVTAPVARAAPCDEHRMGAALIHECELSRLHDSALPGVLAGLPQPSSGAGHRTPSVVSDGPATAPAHSGTSGSELHGDGHGSHK
jgi:hypothetical protein